MVQLLRFSEPTGNFNQNIIVSKFNQEFNTENMRRVTMERRDAGGMVQLLRSSEPTGEHLYEDKNDNRLISVEDVRNYLSHIIYILIFYFLNFLVFVRLQEGSNILD